jgi:5'(3')-deoxyribonucleotidase
MALIRNICYIDMDGVLVDFVEGVCKAKNVENPYTTSTFREYGIEKVLGKDIWEGLEEDFWANLPKSQIADDVIKVCTDFFGKDHCYIATSPTLNVGCASGKKAWIKKYYPELYEKVIIIKEKSLLAKPTSILVDDSDVKIGDFRLAGGYGYLIGRPWNTTKTSLPPEIELDRLEKFFWSITK